MSERYARLAVTTRSGRVECEHWGQLVVSDAEGRVVSAWGDPAAPTYMRSSAKPFQAITCLIHHAAVRFGWTDAEVAVVCSSHSAEADHKRIAASILARAGLSESDLQCGPHPPLGDAERTALARAGQSPTRLDSNCSGKHAGMLACCQAMGWPVGSYLDRAHPLQAANRKTLSRFAGLDADVPTGVDGCGVPSFFVAPTQMAAAYARLVARDNLSDQDGPAAERVVSAMMRHPRLVAGLSRLDTTLMEFAGGQLLVKGGAEGVLCAAIPALGLGVSLKIADGNARAHAAIVGKLLADLLPATHWPSWLEKANSAQTNTRGEIVGAIEATF